MGKTCGIDWSEDQHDVAIVNDAGGIVARARVADDAVGFGRLLELLAEHGEGEPTRIEIAIETDKGLFVAALVAAGFTLFFDQSPCCGSLPRASRASRREIRPR